MEMEVDGAPIGEIDDGGSNVLVVALSNINIGLILRVLKFPFIAIWWTLSNLLTLPYTLASWSAWSFSLPFKIIPRVIHLILAPFRFIFGSAWIPWPWNWSLEAVIDTIGPVLTCLLIAGTVGILAGITTYFIALSLSTITESILASLGVPSPSDPNPSKKTQPKSSSGKQTPTYAYGYDSDDDETSNLNFKLNLTLSGSRRSSFSTDFDTDDASALLQLQPQPRSRPGGNGAELYAAWRERVDSARLSPGPGSGPGLKGGGVLRSPPPVLSPGGVSSSKRRLPGLLFGTTIHEEDDDSL